MTFDLPDVQKFFANILPARFQRRSLGLELARKNGGRLKNTNGREDDPRSGVRQSASAETTQTDFLIIALYAEAAFQFTATQLGDSNRAAFPHSFDPAVFE
jgi:hypothetical protein